MLTLALALIAGVLGYRISLSIWPYTRCGRCSGSGNNAGSTRKRFGNCRRCGGSGSRERLGTRLFVRRH